jgi:hypothetical protein
LPLSNDRRFFSGLDLTIDKSQNETVTLLAAHRLHDIPVLVGDALCTAPDSQSLKKKIYLIAPNLAVGWTGYSLTASSVVGELRSIFAEKIATRSDLEAFFGGFSCPGMYERDVKIVGWIIDDQPSPFIWHSSYPSEVFYNDFYYEGSGEQYYESVIRSSLLSGTSPNRSGHIDVALSAAHSALTHCGQAFFSEQLDYANWDRTFGFAYEVIVYGYGRFWPLGRTMYLPWTYYWNPETKTGNAELAPRLWGMNFLGEYSVLQRADHDDLKLSACRNYPIRPVYPHEIDREEIRKLRFTASADFYVHYFVLHPPQINGLRLGLCIVGDRTSDKVSVYQTNEGVRFRANTTFLDETFRQAIHLVGQSGSPQL